MKLHHDVRDAVAVGIPDDRFGQAVTAVVELWPGATADEAELIAHAKTRLASTKLPAGSARLFDRAGSHRQGRLFEALRRDSRVGAHGSGKLRRRA